MGCSDLKSSNLKPFKDTLCFCLSDRKGSPFRETHIKGYVQGKRCCACNMTNDGWTTPKPAQPATDFNPPTSYDSAMLECSSLSSQPCHYMKGPFSLEHGQTVDNSSMLLQKIAQLLNDSDLSDISVIVGSRTYYAHKLVLCCSSEVFRIMLTSESWADHGKRTIVLQEEEECMGVFEDFLRYLYTAVIHLSHLNVLAVLMLADKYQVLDLQALCMDYMQSHLVSTVSHNQVIPWYQYALLGNHTPLAEDCDRFIQWNFHKVASTKHFCDLELPVLEHFLISPDLVIEDEYTLFELLGKWLKHSGREMVEMDIPMEEIDLPVRVDNEDALHLLSLIRFPMMPPEHLIQLQQEPLALHFSTFFIEQIQLAMKLHYCSLEERSQFVPSGYEYLVQPRNYLNETWSTNLAIENFSTLPLYNMQPLVFSSPVSGAQADENRSWEWHLDLYPKGISFEKCIMINLWRKLEVGGTTSEVVRMVLAANRPRTCKVQVAVLLYGCQDNVEYVRKVYTRNCHFDPRDQAYNLDHLLPYHVLNDEHAHSPYLTGSKGDTFKVTVIIKPG